MSDKIIELFTGQSLIDQLPSDSEPSTELSATVKARMEIEVKSQSSIDDVKDVVIVSEGTNDIEVAKANVKAVSKILEKPLKELRQLAMGSDSPRAYEVLATISKTIVDANKALYDMTVQGKDGDQAKVIDNDSEEVLFRGSPHDLLKGSRSGE